MWSGCWKCAVSIYFLRRGVDGRENCSAISWAMKKLWSEQCKKGEIRVRERSAGLITTSFVSVMVFSSDQSLAWKQTGWKTDDHHNHNIGGSWRKAIILWHTLWLKKPSWSLTNWQTRGRKGNTTMPARIASRLHGCLTDYKIQVTPNGTSYFKQPAELEEEATISKDRV